MQPIGMSAKLDNVCYDIRGPVMKEAKRLEEEGHRILKSTISAILRRLVLMPQTKSWSM